MIAVAVSIAVFWLAWAGFERVRPLRTEGRTPPPFSTPYIEFRPDQSPLAGTVVLIHGLNSNKEFMQPLAMALSDAGYEVYAIDLPGHGDSPLAFTYSGSLDAIRNFLDTFEDRFPGELVLIGHSLGGALLAELASERPFGTLILMSPPPIPLEPFKPFEGGRVLIVTGGFDAPRINAFIPELVEAAGSDAEWWLLPYAAHSTALFDPPKLQALAHWLRPMTGPVRTAERLGWLALMGISALGAPLFLAGIRTRPDRVGPSRSGASGLPHPAREIARWTGALVISGITLAAVAPFEWLHLFAADYLIGSVFLVGALLWKGSGISLPRTGVAVGVLGAAYVIGVLLAGLASQVMHLVPAGTQWLRFPVLAAAGFPLALYDEHVLRPIGRWWQRWLMFASTRALLWAGVVAGVLLFNPESSFLVLIMHFIAVFWMALWWLAGFVARQTREPGAAAVFTALVQGWVFAAVFVRI